MTRPPAELHAVAVEAAAISAYAASELYDGLYGGTPEEAWAGLPYKYEDGHPASCKSYWLRSQQAAIRAYLVHLAEAGWGLTPRDPTPEMIDEGATYHAWAGADRKKAANSIWQAMTDAAPEWPPEEKGDG